MMGTRINGGRVEQEFSHVILDHLSETRRERPADLATFHLAGGRRPGIRRRVPYAKGSLKPVHCDRPHSLDSPQWILSAHQEHVDSRWISGGQLVDERSDVVDKYSALWKCGRNVENLPQVIHTIAAKHHVNSAMFSTFPHRLLLLLLFY